MHRKKCLKFQRNLSAGAFQNLHEFIIKSGIYINVNKYNGNGCDFLQACESSRSE